jgi:carbamoylphosphate synthase large subunit
MGCRVVVLDDNPATLMDVGGEEGDLYLEPPVPEVVRKIIEESGVEEMWPGFGGRRGWRLALRMAEEGWCERLGLRIPLHEDIPLWYSGDRLLFRETLREKRVPNPPYVAVTRGGGMETAVEELGFPLVIRPSFSSGGEGTAVVYNREEYRDELEKAFDSGLTGEVLVEAALMGWRKYIAVVGRDGKGGFRLFVLAEQVDSLPRHEGNSTLLLPSGHLGREECYALGEFARATAEALGLVGVSEVKLAVHPAWEEVYPLDVNPRPWRVTPLAEVFLGVDLVKAHLRLVLGGDLEEIDVPEGTGEVLPLLAASPGGRKLEAGEEARETQVMVESWSVEFADVKRVEGSGAPKPDIAWKRAVEGKPRCLSTTAEGLENAVVMPVDSGKREEYEGDAVAALALLLLREEGLRSVVVTPRLDFALFACCLADAVYLSPASPEAAREVARLTGAGSLSFLFSQAASEPWAAERSGEACPACEGKDKVSAHDLLSKLENAGLPVVSHGRLTGKGGVGLPAGANLPLLLETGSMDWAETVYGPDIPERALGALERGEEVFWREVWEEGQEIVVEMVGDGEKALDVVFWEQADGPGVSTSDGWGKYPAGYLTTRRGEELRDLAHSVVGVLGWKGVMSMRVVVREGRSHVWDVSTFPSPNLPFIYRACGVNLAGRGLLVSLGGGSAAPAAVGGEAAIRIPLFSQERSLVGDILPTPYRRSVGSVLGKADDPGEALAKALWSCGIRPCMEKAAFISVADREKRKAVLLARELMGMGFRLMATRGTARALEAAGLKVEAVAKLKEGRPNIVDRIRNGEVGLVINVPRGRYPRSDGYYIRAACSLRRIPCITSMEAAMEMSGGWKKADPSSWKVSPWLPGEQERRTAGGRKRNAV